jgi:hypothetical protein
MCRYVFFRASGRNLVVYTVYRSLNRPETHIERSIEFVIKVGAGTEAVGLFESIH